MKNKLVIVVVNALVSLLLLACAAAGCSVDVQGDRVNPGSGCTNVSSVVNGRVYFKQVCP